MEKERKKNAKKEKAIFILMCFLIGAMCGVVGGIALTRILPDDASGKEELLGLALVWIVVMLALRIHIYVHETGHLIFGLLSGYQFASIRFGSLMFQKTEEGIKRRKLKIAGTGGQCLMVPPAGQADIPVKLYNWGGCIANLIFSLLMMILSICLQSMAIVSTSLMLVCMAGIGSAIINGVPLRSFSNDGYNAMTLGKRPYARKCFSAQLSMQAELAKGKAVRDMPEDWFVFTEDATLLSDNIVSTSSIIAMEREIDRKNFSEAERMAKFLVAHAQLAKIHEWILHADLLFCELVGEKRTEVIEEMMSSQWQKQLKQLNSQPSMHRVWYAYYLLEKNDEEKAKKHLDMFEKIAQKYPYPSEIQCERELIGYVREKYIASKK